MRLLHFPPGITPDLLISGDRCYLTYQEKTAGVVVYSWPIDDTADLKVEYENQGANQGAFPLLTKVPNVNGGWDVVLAYRFNGGGGVYAVTLHNLMTKQTLGGVAPCWGNNPFVWSDNEPYMLAVQMTPTFDITLYDYMNQGWAQPMGAGRPTGLSRLHSGVVLLCDDADKLYPGVTSPMKDFETDVVGQWKDGGVWCDLDVAFKEGIGVLLPGSYTGNPRIRTLPDDSKAICWWVAGSQPGGVDLVVAWQVTPSDLTPISALPPVIDPPTPVDPVDPGDDGHHHGPPTPIDPGDPPVVVTPPTEETPVPETRQQSDERLAVRIFGLPTFQNGPIGACTNAAHTIHDALGRVPTEFEAIEAAPIYQTDTTGYPNLFAWAATRPKS